MVKDWLLLPLVRANQIMKLKERRHMPERVESTQKRYGKLASGLR